MNEPGGILAACPSCGIKHCAAIDPERRPPVVFGYAIVLCIQCASMSPDAREKAMEARCRSMAGKAKKKTSR